MPNDPFGFTLGGRSLGGSPFDDDDSPFPKRTRRPKALYPAADPATTEAAKQSLVDRGVSGLHYVASALDKPGRAVRGVLDGNAREALAAVPFSDSLGLTDPKQAVSAEDLLVHHGLLDKDDPDNPAGFFSGRTLATLGAGVALDPLTYASFGTSALSKAGLAAKAAGATRGWGHEALIKGFTHHADDLAAAGHTADQIAHIGRQAGNRLAPAGLGVKAGEPLAGSVGVGLPFMDPAFTLGHGRLSQAGAHVGDAVRDAIKYAPGVRTARQWFDTAAGRSDQAIAQRAHEAASVPLQQAVRGQAGVWEYGARKRLGDILGSDPTMKGHEYEGLNLIGGEAERVKAAADPTAWAADFDARVAGGQTHGMANPAAVRAHMLGHFDEYRAIGRDVGDTQAALIPEAKHYGADPHSLADAEAEYARRQYVAGVKGTAAGHSRPQQVFGTSGTYDRARQEILKDIPGGSNTINRWAMDSRLSGPARTLVPADVEKHLLGDMLGQTRQPLPLPPEAMAAMEAKAGHLQQFLADLDPLHADNQVPFYHPDRIADAVQRQQAHGKVVGAAAGSVEGLASGAIPIAEFQPGGRFAGQAHVPLDQAVGRVGLTTHRPWANVEPADLAHLNSMGVPTAEEMRQLVATARTDPSAAATLATLDPAVVARVMRQGYDGGSARLYEQMARHGASLEDLSTGAFDPTRYLKGFAVHEKDAHALSEYMKGFGAPHEAGPFLKGLDGLQNLFKAFTYPLWPASHTRNAFSAAYNNFIHGTDLGSYRDAYRIMRGHGIDHDRYGAALAGLSPQDKAHALSAGAYGHAGVYSGGSFNEASRNPTLGQIDTLSGTPGNLAGTLPGSEYAGTGRTLMGDLGNIVGEGVKGLGTRAGANPLGVRGVGGRVEDTFAPLIAGRKVGAGIADHVRLANYLGNLRKGMTPEVAGATTKRVHFDYGDLTPMESNYFRKLVPFYTFMRKNTPAQADLLLNRPSAIAPTIRAMTGNGRDDQGDFVPDYLASGPAVNLGHNVGPDGRDNTRFLTSFGLPMEEALERLKFRQWDVAGHKLTLPDLIGTGQSVAGMANGYFKAPLEMMTDTQLHTGRRLSDLYKPTFWNGYGSVAGPVGDALSEIGQNMPGTRFGTTFTKLIDDRKPLWARGLNLLTGVKVSDVDTEKARNIEARKAWEEGARQDPRLAAFTHYYVKPDQAGNVDENLARDMQVYARMQREAHEAAEKEKKRREDAARAKAWDLFGGGRGF